MTITSQATAGTVGTTQETVLHRTVMPTDGDYDALPLYVESAGLHPEEILGRHRVEVRPGQRMSFATYFNAFPASYWRRWTIVSAVELRVVVTGEATVMVYRSNARGDVFRVTSRKTSPLDGSLSFELPLDNFGDGGWYWLELIGGQHQGAILESAEWVAAVEAPKRGTVTVGITTFNRPDQCVDLLESLSTGPLDLVDTLLIVDQGNQLVSDDPRFPAVSAALGEKLKVIRQPNLGGSGGFARGMYEAAYNGTSDYVLLLDDDVLIEHEGLLRALTFGDLARTPTIVGGQMLNMYIRSMLHAFGETVNRYRFFWGPAPHTHHALDFAKSSLRDTEWLHRRIDVDYNGWWMCLIPTQTVRDLGLALPIFIKWDDAEFGLRAKEAGVPTVTLPGAAVWHVPWTEKDDTIDWQAYYHARNRVLVALLQSPYPNGGRLLYESLLVQLKHSLAMQYSAAELRLWALNDILSGPDHMHRDIAGKLAEIRQFRSGQDDAIVKKDPLDFPAPKRDKPPKRGKEPTEPRGFVGAAVTAASGAVRQFTPVRKGALERPEAQVPAQDLRWWLLSQFDSALVSNADGTGSSWYKRDRERFKALMSESVAVHRQLISRWDELREIYQTALPEVTSPEAWRPTWGIEASED